MKKYPSKLSELFTEEILKKSYERRFLPGEIVKFADAETIFFVLEGSMYATKPHKKDPIYFPKVISEGEIYGFNFYTIESPVFWEFISITESKVLIIPDNVVKSLILEDMGIYRKLVKIQASVLQYAAKFYFLKSTVDAKAAYAYFLMMNKVDNNFIYPKQEHLHKMIGVGRTSFYKIEREFIEKGIIEKTLKQTTILNTDGLIDYFKDYIDYDEIFNR